MSDAADDRAQREQLFKNDFLEWFRVTYPDIMWDKEAVRDAKRLDIELWTRDPNRDRRDRLREVARRVRMAAQARAEAVEEDFQNQRHDIIDGMRRQRLKDRNALEIRAELEE